MMRCRTTPSCRALALFLLGGLTSLALAQQAPRLEPLPDIPPPPRGATQSPADARLEPQVTIRQEGGNRIEEFRSRGRLYAVRVTPQVGKPYIMIDRTGKGTMTRMDDITGAISPPQWLLFEF